MSTVPGPDTPAPANNAKTLTIGTGSGMYVRPTAGGNATGNVSSPPFNGPGVGDSGAPAGKIPAPVQPAPKEGTPPGGPVFTGATIILTGISGAGDTDNDGDTM